MIDQKLLNKFKALLARADESRNDNAHERDIAMRQAVALLARHNLSMSDVTSRVEQDETMGGLGRVSHTLSSRYVWEAGVWRSIGELYGCLLVRQPNRGRVQVVLVGRQLHCTLTAQMAGYVVASIRREAKKQGHNICSFGVGAWKGVQQQVDRILRDRDAGALDGVEVSTEQAMVLRGQYLQVLENAQRTLRHFYPNAKQQSYQYGGGRTDSRKAGEAYGVTLGLNEQIQSTPNRPALR